MISKDTEVCISIAGKPGDFGARFHNTAYRVLGLNWIYVPRRIDTAQLKSVIEAVRVLNICGCSVSMPHKTEVMKYLDNVDQLASKIGAVNTIVRQSDGTLKGYNTDFYGAKRAIEETTDIKGKEVVLIGGGGVAKSIALVVKELGGILTVTNRTITKAKNIANMFGGTVLPWEDVGYASGYLLINATSVGMYDTDSLIVPEETILRFEVIQDVVIYPAETKLLREAKKQGKKIIPGTIMCVYQAVEQFKIYTGYEVSQSFISKTLNDLTNSTNAKSLNFIIDVDGVMTTGQFLYSANGKTYKIFGPHDTDGLKMIKDKVNIVFITADKLGFPISKKRIDDMGYPIELVNEQDRYNYIKEKYGFENTIFMGDGIFDAPMLKACKFGIASKNARKEAIESAAFVTASNSAEGAVCDACLEIKKRFLEGQGNDS